ncbi:MAG: hypothetical protein HZC54_00030 [Verrucomicrobia bacterium]|nr:hypothetical protein [Verrucomicrobiota bacterium]
MLLAAAITMAAAPVADAAIAAIGPVNPANGFPATVTDTAGVALNLPVPVIGNGLVAPTMIFGPPDPANAFSRAIGFDQEAFYYFAREVFDTPMGRAECSFGVEAAFINGATLNGQQMVFSRIRLRLNTATVPGNYTVTHPYGTTVIPVTALDIQRNRGMNFTQDVILWQLGATVTLAANVGPFLRPTTMALGVDPAAWFGDGVTLGTVTGSPTGFNGIRIVGPPGSGLDVTVSDQWQVSGHRAAAPPPPAGPVILSPAIGSALTAATTTFVLGPGPAGTTQQAVWIGSTAGAFDLAALFVPNNSFTVTLPTDGRVIFVRVWAQVGGVWSPIGDVTFNAMVGTPSALVAPNPAVPMVGAVQNFVWDRGVGVALADHAIWVGSTPNGFDIAALFVNGLGQRVTVPTDGRQLFVKIWSKVGGTWVSNSYQFTAPSAP